MDFDEEEWFFKSVRQYDDLFMYELQAPTHCLEWTDNKTVCVSCKVKVKGQTRSELQLLELPNKLTTQNDQGLVKDRDFRVVGGGFYDGDITSIHHVKVNKSSVLVTTEEGCNSIQTWRLPDDKNLGLITPADHYDSMSQTSVTALVAVSTETDLVAFGSHGNNISIIDLKGGKQISFACSVEARLGGLCWLDSHTLAFCSRVTGQVWSGRISGPEEVISGPEEQVSEPEEQLMVIAEKQCGDGPWSMTRCPDTSDLLLCNSRGTMVTVNVSNRGQHKSWKVDLGPVTEGTLDVKFSPTDSELFSVSGSDGSVRIFKKHSPDATFTHQGHLAYTSQSQTRVKGHIWHPSIPCLLLSCADDGSLQSWKYVRR